MEFAMPSLSARFDRFVRWFVTCDPRADLELESTAPLPTSPAPALMNTRDRDPVSPRRPA